MDTLFQIQDGRTEVMQDEIERCEDIDELQMILDKNSQYFTDWKAYINYLVDSSGYSYRQFAKQCGMSHNTIKTWCEKGLLPRSRNQFIQIGFGLKMSLETMNKFLQRYGKYPQLYPKSIEDAIYIFALNQGMPFSATTSLQNHFNHFIEEISNSGMKTKTIDMYYNTEDVQEELLSLNDIKQFEGYVTEHIDVFLSSYDRLISFLDAYIDINTMSYTAVDSKDSLNSFLQSKIKSHKLLNHYNKTISNLKNHRIVPKRSGIIALGVYLDMSLSDLNIMLSMAGMEPLCAKDKVECVIIFAIEDAVINNPDIEFSNALLLNNLSDNLELKEHCRSIIKRYEVSPYKSAEEDGGVMKYVYEALKSIDMDSVSDLTSFFTQTTVGFISNL